MKTHNSPIEYKGFFIYWSQSAKDVYVNDSLACGRIRHFKSMHAAKCFISRYMVPAYAAGSYRAV